MRKESSVYALPDAKQDSSAIASGTQFDSNRGLTTRNAPADAIRSAGSCTFESVSFRNTTANRVVTNGDIWVRIETSAWLAAFAEA